MLARGELRRGARAEPVRATCGSTASTATSRARCSRAGNGCLHLDDGTQLMIFDFNREPAERFAVIVDAMAARAGSAPTRCGSRPLARWRSPRSGIDYPCAWRVRTATHDLEVRPGTSRRR
jgi:predicted secreted hydrolase